MNRLDGGRGGGGKGLERQQKFSLGSHTAAVGVQLGFFLNKNGGGFEGGGGQPIFVLSPGSRTSVTYQRNSGAPFIYCL